MEEESAMRAWVRALGLGLVVAVAAAGFATAQDVSGGNQASETIVLFSETQVFRSVDVGPRGFSVGDQDIFVDRLFDDEAKTHLVGRDRVIAEWLPASYVMVQLEYTLRGRGKLVAAGTLNFGSAFETRGDNLAITGGTGDFAHASGWVHLSVFDAETFLNEIHVAT
jgi:hypothetical protein